MEESKELSATAILKQNVASTLATWNKSHVCSALFANISAKKIESFISVTENCTKYPVKNYDGKDAIISTEIIDGKDFSFYCISRDVNRCKCSHDITTPFARTTER
jgi:hypothetical protein